jgi:hypothetical protein
VNDTDFRLVGLCRHCSAPLYAPAVVAVYSGQSGYGAAPVLCQRACQCQRHVEAPLEAEAAAAQALVREALRREAEGGKAGEA